MYPRRMYPSTYFGRCGCTFTKYALQHFKYALKIPCSTSLVFDKHDKKVCCSKTFFVLYIFFVLWYVEICKLYLIFTSCVAKGYQTLHRLKQLNSRDQKTKTKHFNFFFSHLRLVLHLQGTPSVITCIARHGQ